MVNHGISTGALFLGLGMLYDRRHTYEIKEFGGLVNPMPVLMSFFIFICLSSLALPPLNSFIGEFLILVGVFQHHHAWASWAASGAVLSAIYLLWSYQRVALGEVTVEKNRTLPDASRTRARDSGRDGTRNPVSRRGLPALHAAHGILHQ